MRQSRKQGQPIVAVDLGGTKILAAVVSPQGEVIAREYRLTMAEEGPEAVIRRIIASIERVIKLANVRLSQLTSVGIAAAGALDSKEGIVSASPNLPNWHDVPLRDTIGERLGVNAFLINDASAAALGEHHFGAGKGVDDLIYITVGTGIGGGIIIGGRLYSGVCGTAGELGHMSIDVNGIRCNCGNIGCLETLASGVAVAREAISRIGQGAKTSMTKLVEGRVESITAQTVSLAAQGGDHLALDIITRAGTYLGIGMVNLVNLFNPEMIIVGGGMAKMGDMLLFLGRPDLRERAFQLLTAV